MSVSGSPLVGKSSMLNLIVSFFARTDSIARAKDTEVFKYHNIYEIGDGKKSTTQGIDMFCVTVGGQHLIILDVEGDNDPHRKSMGTWIYTNLILTALSVSHVHVYNYNLLLQQNFLDYFRSIDKIIREKKYHPEFSTHLYILKKDYQYTDQDDHSESSYQRPHPKSHTFKSYLDRPEHELRSKIVNVMDSIHHNPKPELNLNEDSTWAENDERDLWAMFRKSESPTKFTGPKTNYLRPSPTRR